MPAFHEVTEAAFIDEHSGYDFVCVEAVTKPHQSRSLLEPLAPRGSTPLSPKFIQRDREVGSPWAFVRAHKVLLSQPVNQVDLLDIDTVEEDPQTDLNKAFDGAQKSSKCVEAQEADESEVARLSASGLVNNFDLHSSPTQLSVSTLDPALSSTTSSTSSTSSSSSITTTSGVLSLFEDSLDELDDDMLLTIIDEKLDELMDLDEMDGDSRLEDVVRKFERELIKSHPDIVAELKADLDLRRFGFCHAQLVVLADLAGCQPVAENKNFRIEGDDPDSLRWRPSDLDSL